MILPVLLSGLYLLLLHLVSTINPEHLLLVAFLLSLYYLHAKSRRFVIDLLPFTLFGVLYDFLRVIPKGWAGPIHVASPYRLEKFLFGFFEGGMIPTEFFQNHTHPALDLLAAITYSLHMVVPLLFAFTLWFRNRPVMRTYARAFLIANLLAFLTYIALPVAPPWYVEIYDFTPADWSIPGNAAGLLHFDRMIGHPYFETIYAKSAWVFGAVPSMHAGFPLLTVIFAHKAGWKRLLPFLYLFLGLVWFSAVYLRHHYLIDLLAGALYVLATVYLYERLIKTDLPSHKDPH